jgi:hypothetical protein
LPLRQIVLGDLDPAIRDPFQIGEIARFDFACLAQAIDDFLDQQGVFCGELDRQPGNAFAVKVGHHDPAPARRA